MPYKTFKYRLKSKNLAKLNSMAGAVNFVWNYCNETCKAYLEKRNEWLSGYDLQVLTKGCSKELGLNGQTIQAICQEFANRRHNKVRLSWRSAQRSLGWIPFNGQAIVINNDVISHNGFKFRFWKSRPIQGNIKFGSFSQDSQGKWYVNIICETEDKPKYKSGGCVGIDLGLKTLATLSNGDQLSRESLIKKYEGRLAMAQRGKKRRQVKAIHSKIANTRKDWAHKTTTKLINQFDEIYVGNVSASKLKKTRMSKSVSDASWSTFREMLAYKAIGLGVEYAEVNEMFSSVTCSVCFERSGPSGLGALGVREWICKCGASHNRDVNAAKNILRIGHDTPIKGSPTGRMPKDKDMTLNPIL